MIARRQYMKQKLSDKFLIVKKLYRKRSTFVGVCKKVLPASNLVLQNLLSIDINYPWNQLEPPLQNFFIQWLRKDYLNASTKT